MASTATHDVLPPYRRFELQPAFGPPEFDVRMVPLIDVVARSHRPQHAVVEFQHRGSRVFDAKGLPADEGDTPSLPVGARHQRAERRKLARAAGERERGRQPEGAWQLEHSASGVD